MRPIILQPDALYRTDQLGDGLGIGEDLLAQGRADDFLHPVKFAHALWYEGSELLAWIRAKATIVRPRNVYEKRKAS